MSARLFKKRQHELLTKYIDDHWSWHFKANGTVWVENLKTGDWEKIGKIEANNPRPVAVPTTS